MTTGVVEMVLIPTEGNLLEDEMWLDCQSKPLHNFLERPFSFSALCPSGLVGAKSRRLLRVAPD
jgi:hypothetical protein